MPRYKESGLDILEEIFQSQNEELEFGEADCGA